MRGQTTLEYLLLIAAILVIASLVVMVSTKLFAGKGKEAQYQACLNAAKMCNLTKKVNPNAQCPGCEEACSGLGPSAVSCCEQGLDPFACTGGGGATLSVDAQANCSQVSDDNYECTCQGSSSITADLTATATIEGCLSGSSTNTQTATSTTSITSTTSCVVDTAVTSNCTCQVSGSAGGQTASASDTTTCYQGTGGGGSTWSATADVSCTLATSSNGFCSCTCTGRTTTSVDWISVNIGSTSNECTSTQTCSVGSKFSPGDTVFCYVQASKDDTIKEASSFTTCQSVS